MLSRRLWLAARQTALLTPVLVTIVLVAAFLALTGIDYETYMIGGSYLTFLLGPATVALAVPPCTGPALTSGSCCCRSPSGSPSAR